MSCHPDARMEPRNGHSAVVGIVARISGCANQKEQSLEDQVDHGKEVAGGYFSCPIDYRIFSTRGKGESLERPELAEIVAMLRTRELDMLVAEDLGRWVRGGEAVKFCGIAIDHGTRVLAPNDDIDTASDSWEEDALSACRDHVGHNAHTSRRLKKKLMNRFLKLGGATPREIYGYIKPEGAKTYDAWLRDPEAVKVYPEWFARLRARPNCQALADWLNSEGVPTGKYARKGQWDGPMVRRITGNTLLKGRPGRGFKHTTKHNESGWRISVKNPKGASFLHYPHLVHIPPDEFDEVNALLDAANKGCGRKPVDGEDPLVRVPRNRTRFPGQHACCHYCGRQYVWGGNGLAENLMCNGSRGWRCWNTVGFNGALAASRVCAAIMAQLVLLDGFDDQFRALVEAARHAGGGDQDHHRARLKKEEEVEERHRANLLASMKEYGPSALIREGLATLETKRRELLKRRHELDRLRERPLDLPGSTAELRVLIEEKLGDLAADSPEFGDLLRRIAPEFRVHLVRLCDGGRPLPRARITLNLAGLVLDARHCAGLGDLVTREVTIDLFEPPQRERIRVEAVRLEKAGFQQRAIAKRVSEPATQPAVGNALALDRLMRERGLTTPYEVVAEPPEDYKKLRHHRNPKYRFEPSAGYEPPPL